LPRISKYCVVRVLGAPLEHSRAGAAAVLTFFAILICDGLAVAEAELRTVSSGFHHGHAAAQLVAAIGHVSG
jgi:hypothetical protein